MTTRMDGNVFVTGNLSATSLNIPANTVIDAGVSGSADIDADKLEHLQRVVWSDESGTTTADKEHVIAVVNGTSGTLRSFKVGAVVANVGAAVVDVDLHKNGSTVLSSAVQIDSADSAYALVSGTFAATALAADDVLEISIDATAGGGTLSSGLFVILEYDEKAS